MKLLQTIFALCLICAIGSSAFSQEKSKEKDRKTEQKPIEVKTNLLVLDANNKYVDGIKQEDLKIFEDGVEQKITSLTKKEPNLNMGLVIDNTGSMRLQLNGINDISQILVNNLQGKDEALLIRFVSSDNIMVMQSWTSDKASLNKAIGQMYIQGGASAVIDALYLAAEEIIKRKKENNLTESSIVLISDCEDRDSFYTKKKLFEKLEGSGIQVFVIALTQGLETGVREKSESFANEIALKTGGTVHFPTSKENYKKPLLENLKPLIYELRAQYLIGYTSTNPNRNNKERKMTVQIADSEKGEKRQGFVRESFVVPKEQNKK
ncbi:MAG TPA: VWA domain-containing protein [Pyrinomonadaceae bacterium]|jgi:Ca-activated chloride channel family protein|nr:VWA domain-containing protein [Pyrinomonadaceae bacterium]